nr:unnamed protein product [Callosobruchus analis]
MTHCEKFDFKTKLVAQTYDGAAVMASELNGLQSKIKSVAPQALFSHCYIRPRPKFAFFSKSTKRTNILNEICGAKLSSNAATRWNFTSRAVFTVLANKQSLFEVFNFIVNNDSFKNDNHTIREAVGLRNHMQDSKFCFLLQTFNLIFAQTDVVFACFQNKLTNVNYARNQLFTLISTLQKYRADETYFKNIFSGLKTEEPTQKRRKITLDAAVDIEQNYRVIFNEILDTVIMQINFFDLLNIANFSVYAKGFPTDLFTSLTKQYPIFDKIQLKNELLVIYNDLQMFEGCTTQNQILEFMYKNELHECLPELYKLLNIIVTIPARQASVFAQYAAVAAAAAAQQQQQQQTAMAAAAAAAAAIATPVEPPPRLEHPDRVVRVPQEAAQAHDRFGGGGGEGCAFQPNVALAPPSHAASTLLNGDGGSGQGAGGGRRYGRTSDYSTSTPSPTSQQDSTEVRTPESAADSMKEPSEHSDKEQPDQDHLSEPDLNHKEKEETSQRQAKVEPTERTTDCGSTMVSVVVHNNSNHSSMNHTKYNPEIELSTDTEDSASESSEKISALSKVEEHESRAKDMRISELEKQINELKALPSNETPSCHAKEVNLNSNHVDSKETKSPSTDSTVENPCTTEQSKSRDVIVEKSSSVIAAVEDQKESIIRKAAQ